MEIALPLTILAFILLSGQSPLLRMHLDRIVDWLCDHDYVVKAVTVVIAAIPIWMMATMLRENPKR